jgi:hypothetical protein
MKKFPCFAGNFGGSEYSGIDHDTGKTGLFPKNKDKKNVLVFYNRKNLKTSDLKKK